MRLRPFIRYYGSKWRLAPLYPPPQGQIIIEPFCGSAQYATLYPDRDVRLYDLDEKLIGAWSFLIKATEREILSLPLMLSPGEHIDDHSIPQEAKWLIGYWINMGGAPVKQRTSMSRNHLNTSSQGCTWSEPVRARLAASVKYIRHWEICLADYREAPDIKASWFIDPPYQIKGGQYYRKGSRGLDYQELSAWVKSRQGLRIVCEGQGADWLDFKVLRNHKGIDRSVEYQELVWTDYVDPQLELWSDYESA